MNWPLCLGVLLFLLPFGIYVAWPAFVSATAPVDEFALQPHVADQIRARATSAVACLWFFVLGSTIGSFLNVVAYRMPLGISFVAKPSRCPFCETPILFKHNVPIFGWLALRGRCHACRLSISSRYILVEILVGVLFVSLVCALVVSGGANLPIRTPNRRVGVMWNIFTPQWDLIRFYCLHAFLLAVLSTIALMKLDRFRIPIRLVLFTLVVGIASQVVWPHLSLVPWGPNHVDLGLAPSWLPWVDPIVGLVIGLLVGTTQFWLTGKSYRARLNDTRVGPNAGYSSRWGSVAIYAIVGTFLGWQSVVPALLIATFVQFAVTVIGRVIQRPTGQLWAMSSLLGTWLMLCLWRQLPRIGMPHVGSTIFVQYAWLLFAVATVLVVENLAKDELTLTDGTSE